MKHKLFTLALFAAIALPYAAYAETPMELVIVTPDRFVATPENSTVDVTVITADEIEHSAAKTLPELLSLQAGIQVRSNDGTRDMAIDLRGFGMTGNQNTLVLLDGQPLNDIQLTSIRWSAIPLESIDRIEIINGSGSVLYGGGATGGTINIITKHPGKEMRGNAGIGLGSYDTREWQLALSGAGDHVGMRVTASGMYSSNYRTNNDIAQKNLEADLRTDMGRGDAVIKFGADTQNLRYPGSRTVDPSVGMNELAADPRGTSTPLDYGKRDGGHVSLGTVQQLDFGQFAGELSYRDTKQQAYFDYYCSCGGDYLDTSLNLFSFTPRVKTLFQIGSSGNELIVGADLAKWDYDSRRSSSGTLSAHVLAKQSNGGLYAQNTAQFGVETKVTLGIRSQHVDYQASDAVNPASYASGNRTHTVNSYEIGLRRNLNQDLSFFARIGRSFRIATVDEIFGYNGAPSYDSRITILEPQTSHDGEVGISYKSEINKVRAALFQMNLNNEIHFNSLVGAFGANVNLSPTRRYGMELEGAYNFTGALEITAAYSYTVAKFREGIYGGVNVSGNDIPLVPRHRFALSSSWKVSEQDTFNANAVYVGEQHFDNDQADTFGQHMPAYITVDMKLSHRKGSWLLAAAVNNMFNRQYFTYAVASNFTPGKYNAYPMRERNFSLNATYYF